MKKINLGAYFSADEEKRIEITVREMGCSVEDYVSSAVIICLERDKRGVLR